MSTVKEKDVAHALVFPENIQALRCNICAAKWTPECITLIKEIISYTTSADNFSSIPTSSLKSILEIDIDGLLLVQAYCGLQTNDLKFFNPASEIKPFILIKNKQGILVLLEKCINEWVDNYLVPFMEKHGLPDLLRDRLFSLLDEKNFFIIEENSFDLLPWGTLENGTATPVHSSHGFSITANDIARLLEGEVIFPELPPMIRIIGSDLGSNKAELMTPIIDHFQEKGLFSLVCSISIETLPTVNQPLININFHRRRWVTSLKEDFSQNKNASAFLFVEELGRAFSFNITKKINENDHWKWSPDESLDALQKRFNLPDVESLEDVLKINKTGMRIGVSHSFSSDGGGYSGKNKLGAGVTERDRLDAFSNIVEKLSPLGFQVFSSFKKITNEKQFLKSDVLAYMDLVTLCMSINEEKENDIEYDGKDFQDNTTTNENEIIDSLGNEWFEMISELEEKFSEANTLGKAKKVQQMSDKSRDLVRNFFAMDRQPVILLACQDQKQQSIIKYMIHKLFGDSIKVVSTLVPPDVHGPKKSLPGADLKTVDRLQLRKEYWERFIDGILAQQTIDMCLIQADQYYDTGYDDQVNKAAAKIALSSHSGIPTQYLNPIDYRIRKKDKQLEDYFNRIKSALFDLVFGHHGIVPAVSESTAEYFPEKDSRPKFIYGISCIKVNSRSGSNTPSELAVATRISTETGHPEVKFCHFDHRLNTTEWLTYREAIKYICSRYNSKISLGKNTGNMTRKDVFESFCKVVFKEANQIHGILYLDADHAKSLSPWMTDSKIESNTNSMLSSYPSLRVIRVRRQAPQIMIEKYSENHLTPTTCRRIFTVNTGTVPIYWSLGLPLTHYKRGLSTYRSIELPSKGKIETFAPVLDQTPTPNAVEFVVMLTYGNESTDRLIQFTTSLRTGILQANFSKFVTKPAPLFIISKLKEYFEL